MYLKALNIFSLFQLTNGLKGWLFSFSSFHCKTLSCIYISIFLFKLKTIREHFILLIKRFLSWLGLHIFTFGNVSRDTSLVIGQSGLIFFPLCIVLTRKLVLFPFGYTVFTILTPGCNFGCNLVINYI